MERITVQSAILRFCYHMDIHVKRAPYLREMHLIKSRDAGGVMGEPVAMVWHACVL